TPSLALLPLRFLSPRPHPQFTPFPYTTPFRSERGGQPVGVEPAGIAADPAAVRADPLEAPAQLVELRGLVSRPAGGALPRELQHRLVREHVQRQDVEGRRGEELRGGTGAVRTRRGHVPDAQRA